MPARKRRAGRATEKAACAALRLRARSPAGIPLTVLASGTFVPKAQRRARLPKTERKAAACRNAPSRSQRCTSRAGRRAGRHDARAARVRIVSFRPRAPHSLRHQGVPSRKASFESEIGCGYCLRFRQVKGVGNYADESEQAEARVLPEGSGTPMIRSRKAAPERIWQKKIRARAPHPAPLLRPAVRNGALKRTG